MWQLGLAMAPMVLDQLMPRPEYPGGPSMAMPVMPDRTKYLNSVLETGFNPDSDLYRLAADEVGNQVRSQLARMGMGGSSYGLQAMGGAQMDLARKFAAEQFEKRLKALSMANGMDQFVAEMQMGVNRGNAMDAMNRFNYENERRNQMIGGVGNLAAAGSQYITQQQTRGDQLAWREQQQRNFDNLYGNKPQIGVPYGATPGYMPPFTYDSKYFGSL
jgi:hypothetical protein